MDVECFVLRFFLDVGCGRRHVVFFFFMPLGVGYRRCHDVVVCNFCTDCCEHACFAVTCVLFGTDCYGRAWLAFTEAVYEGGGGTHARFPPLSGPCNATRVVSVRVCACAPR